LGLNVKVLSTRVLLAVLVLVTVGLVAASDAEARRGPLTCAGIVVTEPVGGAVAGEVVQLVGVDFPAEATLVLIYLHDDQNFIQAVVLDSIPGLFNTEIAIPDGLTPGSYLWSFEAVFPGAVVVSCNSSVPFEILLPLFILPPGVGTTTSIGAGTQPPPPTTAPTTQPLLPPEEPAPEITLSPATIAADQVTTSAAVVAEEDSITTLPLAAVDTEAGGGSSFLLAVLFGLGLALALGTAWYWGRRSMSVGGDHTPPPPPPAPADNTQQDSDGGEGGETR